MRLLLVEDDVMIGESVLDLLRANTYAVDWVRDGMAAECALTTQGYDLVLLDLGLPRKDGLDVLRNLRSHKQRTPVLITTARDAVVQRVAGLDAGAARQLGDKRFRVYTLPTQTRLIEVMHDEAVRSDRARKLAFRTILPILILGPLLLLIVWWGISRALRPLATSRDEIARRDANDLRALQTRNVPQELLPFIVEINILFARIGRAFAAQQNFVADAAHELRSPLAALRLQVQGLQRAGSDEARQIATVRLTTGIDRATRLIEQMLVLAREEGSPQDATPCNLAQALRVALSDILALAQARHLDVSANLADTDDAFPVRGNAEALRILLRNLLENAAKYAPEQGVIHLSLRRDDRQIILCIEDNGPGIPEQERARIFDRFHRGEGHDASGSGLGLSIVKAIAERHRIRIELDQSAGLGGLCVRLTLPPA